MNILPFPRFDANVTRPTVLAQLAMDGELRALVALINTLGYSRAEVVMVLTRCGVGDIQELIGMPHLIASVARGLVLLPQWVAPVHWAITRLTPRNWHRLSYILPYAIKPTADPERLCLVNRGYKPVGSDECLGFVLYESARPSHITRAHFETLERAGVVSPCGSFYDSGCHPSDGAVNVETYRRKVAALLAPWVTL